MTKQQQSIVDRYNRATKTSLDECYKTCSHYKTRAEYFIKQEMLNRNGGGYRILSHNSNFFTCAYVYTNENGNDILVYHTAYKKQEIEL